MNVVDLLRDLVRIPSESGNEGAIADYLEGTLRSIGLAPKRDGRNVTVLLDGGDGPLLLLNSHTDTVPIGQGWTKDPLAAELIDGKIYGRGSNDAKGCLAAMIIGAAAAFKAKAPHGKVLIAASCEEETLGQGLEKLLPRLPRPDAAVVGEPTGLQPAVAQKGLLLLEVTANGRSAHAAWGGGVNAIEAAARDVTALSRLAFDRKHPVLGQTSLAVTQIAGGTRHNVIPDSCKLVVDIRTVPNEPVDDIIAKVTAAVEGAVSVRSRRLNSVETDAAHLIVRAAIAARPGAKPYGSPTLSDWVFLKDIPTVKIGPGQSPRSHTPDEYVEVGELNDGAIFYENLIHHYFGSTRHA